MKGIEVGEHSEVWIFLCRVDLSDNDSAAKYNMDKTPTKGLSRICEQGK